jgi:type III secretion protein J
MSVRPGERRCHLVALLVGFVASACTVPVAAGIDDPDANRVVSALEGAGIAAEKAQDPGADGRYHVDVPRAEAARAVALLGELGLPPRRAPGVLDALGTGALVPSRAAEHERLLVGLAGELERTLSGMDGVASARVHLAVPRQSSLRDDPEVRPSASVLIQYRGKSSPLPDADVRQLVTHAVTGLDPERVYVVSVAVSLPLPRDLERVGPLTTTRDVARKLRLALFALAVLGVALAGCLVFLWSRARNRF